MRPCKDCRYYTPKYFQQGTCTRNEHPGAKFFVMEDKALIVHETHGCNEFQRPDVEKETL